MFRRSTISRGFPLVDRGSCRNNREDAEDEGNQNPSTTRSAWRSRNRSGPSEAEAVHYVRSIAEGAFCSRSAGRASGRRTRPEQ